MKNSFRFTQWNHLFYFLLQGIILILKCSRYFTCSESNKKDVYFFMIFSFGFFFERSMQIPIQILTGSIQDKDIEYFTFSYLHGSWLLILWFHWGLCNKKKEHLGFLADLTISKRQRRRNMAIELDSRHPLLPKLKGKMKI